MDVHLILFPKNVMDGLFEVKWILKMADQDAGPSATLVSKGRAHMVRSNGRVMYNISPADPEGISSGSRWLSEARATQPEYFTLMIVEIANWLFRDYR